MNDRGGKKRANKGGPRSRDAKNNNKARNEPETSKITPVPVPEPEKVEAIVEDNANTFEGEDTDVINASLIVNVSENSIFVPNSMNTTRELGAPKNLNDIQENTTSNESEVSESATESESLPESSRSAPPDFKDIGEKLGDMANLNMKNIELLKRSETEASGGNPRATSTPKAHAETNFAFEDDNVKNGNGNNLDASAKKSVTFAEVLKQGGGGDFVVPDMEEEDLSNSVYFSLLKSPESVINESVTASEVNQADISESVMDSVLATTDVSTVADKSELDVGSISTRFDGMESSETLINISSWDATGKIDFDSTTASEGVERTGFHDVDPGQVSSVSSAKLQDSFIGNVDVDDDAADAEVDKINTGLMLPNTVTELQAPNGVKVYVVGTAHFSEQSQQDVIETIEKLQPTLVVLELCSSRRNILTLDEETILRESADMSITKVREAIKQSGAVQGALHLILLSMSAHLTKKLGMAPGGEFRAAMRAVRNVPQCFIILGDRPFKVTLSRALAALTFGQKLKLAWQFLTSNDDITKDEIERCKEKDLLEKLMLEMTGEFPAISNVFVNERDAYLAHSLYVAATAESHRARGGPIVGVVGMGHVAGITKHWGKTTEEQIDSYMIIPEPTVTSIIARATLKYSFYLLLGFGAYKVTARLFGLPREGLTRSVYDNVVKYAQSLPSVVPRK